MPEVPTSQWPVVRINPDLIAALEKKFGAAGDRSSRIQLVNDLLADCDAALAPGAKSKELFPTIRRLRDAAAHGEIHISFNYDSLVEKVLAIEKEVAALRNDPSRPCPEKNPTTTPHRGPAGLARPASSTSLPGSTAHGVNEDVPTLKGPKETRTRRVMRKIAQDAQRKS